MARAIRTVSCQDCGADYETIAKNTKYCKVCRTFRDVVYIQRLGNRTKDCVVCESKYLPLMRENGFGICLSCDPNEHRGNDRGTCRLCKQPDQRLLHAEIQVCRRCAQDPEKRGLFAKALSQKQAARRRESS